MKQRIIHILTRQHEWKSVGPIHRQVSFLDISLGGPLKLEQEECACGAKRIVTEVNGRKAEVKL